VTPAGLELLRCLKRSLDPKGLLNRGKVIDAWEDAGKEPPLNSRHLVDPEPLPALDVLRRTLHARP
jgi:hypothetical protein